LTNTILNRAAGTSASYYDGVISWRKLNRAFDKTTGSTPTATGIPISAATATSHNQVFYGAAAAGVKRSIAGKSMNGPGARGGNGSAGGWGTVDNRNGIGMRRGAAGAVGQGQ
jgi:hypothetical protein